MSTFAERLAWGDPAVDRVVEMLRRRNPTWLVTKQPPPRTREEDKGDIHVEIGRLGLRVIEVKRLSRHFTCFGDWPFNDHEHPEVRKYIVNGKDSFDLKLAQGIVPWGTFALNKDMTHYAFLLTPSDWRTSWWLEEKADPNAGKDKTKPYYVANAEECIFGELGIH